MDSYVLARLARALTREYGGARVQKVWQDLHHRLILRLRRAGESALLMLSGHPDGSGVGVIAARPEAPTRPPALAAYLRAHLEGAQLLGVEPVDYQRILCLHFGGPRGPLELVVEAFRPPNLLALDAEGVLRAALRWEPGGAVDDGKTATKRSLRPGQPYRLPAPPAGRFTPDQWLDGKSGDLPENLRECESALLGPTPALSARAMDRRNGRNAREGLEWLARAYRADGPLTRQGQALVVGEGSPVEEGDDATALALAGEWLLERLEAQRDEQGQRSAARDRKRREKQLNRRLEKIRAELAELELPEFWRARGDALAASLGQVRKGDVRVELGDPARPGQRLVLELDPTLTPAQNLERLYRKARKAGRALESATQRLAQTQRELEATPEEGAEPHKPLYASIQNLPFRRYVSSDGWSIWVGRNSRENDRLVRESKPWDLWLHARDGAGAHVVIRKPGKESTVPQATLTEAAGLAALHSRRKDEAVVDVMVVEISRLRKPKGAGPGRVLVAGERTLRVRPGPGRAQAR